MFQIWLSTGPASKTLAHRVTEHWHAVLTSRLRRHTAPANTTPDTSGNLGVPRAYVMDLTGAEFQLIQQRSGLHVWSDTARGDVRPEI